MTPSLPDKARAMRCATATVDAVTLYLSADAVDPVDEGRLVCERAPELLRNSAP